METTFRALTKDDIEVRVQSANENGFVLLIYKNARVDQNILDETFGAFGWQNKYEEYKGNLYCSIGIRAESGEWIWKSNCGTESNTEKEKGEASDAFKRSGFNWGIGRELYTAPNIKIKGNVKEKKDRNDKKVYVPIYYAFDVTKFAVEETPNRHISELTIVGKSMEGGYHEDVIFDWGSKKPMPQNAPQSAPAKSEPPKSSNAPMTLEEAKKRTTKAGTPFDQLSDDFLQKILDSNAGEDSKTAARLILKERDYLHDLTPIDDGDLPF